MLCTSASASARQRRELRHAAVRVVELQGRHRTSRAASVADTHQQGLSNLFPGTPLASEYGTGPVHSGRIDSLGLDESGAPVVVE